MAGRRYRIRIPRPPIKLFDKGKDTITIILEFVFIIRREYRVGVYK